MATKPKKKPTAKAYGTSGAVGLAPGIAGRPLPNLSEFPKPGTALPTGGVVPKPGQLPPGGFDPYHTPDTAPFGSYDPQLDTQEQTAGANALFGSRENALAGVIAGEDFWHNVGQLGLAHSNALQSLQTASDRATQDYNQALWDTGLKYVRQGQAQGQAIDASGTAHGGALVAAQQAREQNKALENQAQKTAYDRSMWDIGLRGQQENQQYGQSIADLQTNFQRGVDARALDESNRNFMWSQIYQPGIEKEKIFAAQQAGMLPTPPSNEHINPATGVGDYLTRVNTHNGLIYHVHPNGQKVIVGRQPVPKKK